MSINLCPGPNSRVTQQKMKDMAHKKSSSLVPCSSGVQVYAVKSIGSNAAKQAGQLFSSLRSSPPAIAPARTAARAPAGPTMDAMCGQGEEPSLLSAQNTASAAAKEPFPIQKLSAALAPPAAAARAGAHTAAAPAPSKPRNISAPRPIKCKPLGSVQDIYAELFGDTLASDAPGMGSLEVACNAPDGSLRDFEQLQLQDPPAAGAPGASSRDAASLTNQWDELLMMKLPNVKCEGGRASDASSWDELGACSSSSGWQQPCRSAAAPAAAASATTAGGCGLLPPAPTGSPISRHRSLPRLKSLLNSAPSTMSSSSRSTPRHGTSSSSNRPPCARSLFPSSQALDRCATPDDYMSAASDDESIREMNQDNVLSSQWGPTNAKLLSFKYCMATSPLSQPGRSPFASPRR